MSSGPCCSSFKFDECASRVESCQSDVSFSCLRDCGLACLSSRHPHPAASCCQTVQGFPFAPQWHRLLTRCRRSPKSLRLRRSSDFLRLLHLHLDLFTCGSSDSFLTSSSCLSSFFFVASNLFLHFSECDIVPRPTQRGQPGATPCSSTHLCVMYCLLMTRSLAAPPGLVFVGVPRECDFFGKCVVRDSTVDLHRCQ